MLCYVEFFKQQYDQQTDRILSGTRKLEETSERLDRTHGLLIYYYINFF